MAGSCCVKVALICIALVCSFIFVGIPCIVYFEVVKPRHPTFTLNHASVTGFNITSDGRLTSFFDIMIQANNRNQKLKLKYSDVRVSIFKDKQNLAEDPLKGFTQHKRNVTFLRSHLVALNVTLKNGPTFDFGIESGMGYLDFDVFMTAILDGRHLHVNCQHVILNITATPWAYATSSSIENNNSNNSSSNAGDFRAIGCSVKIYGKG